MKNVNLQFFQEELKRISEWIRFTDQKAALVAVYYSALISFLVVKKDIIVICLKQLSLGELFILNSILFLLLIFITLGIFYLFSSIFPRLKNHFNKKSLFYFGTISRMEFLNFIEKMGSLSEDEMKKQIIEQIYILSVIADQKMNNIQNSIRCLFVSIFFILMIYIYFNL